MIARRYFYTPIDWDDGNPCLALANCPAGDDTVAGTTVSAGPDGVLDSYMDRSAYGVPSIMTSDVLLPVPNTYKTDDLDQVRFHLKHP